ncbi:saccharopine dehydrogenase C-terminal domain-containing protein [Gynurincola endophyticus]|uniref:saccharopine dehydrogenase C-terminal domain-containing protein n=1 Tax=Gynurincola endophyticus TaxID=2479004 RepID=UPI000F8EC351|nr:saccharopine dehydrogenase C-terminal domain-containing protein [Gynurincola endophyticus]
MNTILVIGAGKSSIYLIEYLSEEVAKRGWNLIVADGQPALAAQKIKNPTRSKAVALDVTNTTELSALVNDCQIVISMMPHALHQRVAEVCIAHKKNLLTASYVDNEMKSLIPEIEEKGLLFLCEMGLDPGIDHMSAMKLIHDIQAKGGSIQSFYSHCGGLIHPDSDNNPWHYKITWNPRNVVNAGKAGAVFLKDGKQTQLPYAELFKNSPVLPVNGWGDYAWYANRDSISYIDIYKIPTVQNFVRTTLRKPDYNSGWQQMIEWGLTDDTHQYTFQQTSLGTFFQSHLEKNGHWNQWTSLRQNTDQVLTKQLLYLGFEDQNTLIPFEKGTATDVMEFVLETKLKLSAGDKDLIIMVHEIEYLLEGKHEKVTASLVVAGEDEAHTAMAKTVSMPLAIAAVKILEGSIAVTGLHIPTIPEIYEPVLEELERFGISFTEEKS